MKMVLAVVQDKDANRLANKFTDSDIRATKLTSSGGFLKEGNSTFIIGIEEERVAEVLQIIQEITHMRKQYLSPPISMDFSLNGASVYPIEVEVGGATVFVLPVENFFRF